MRKLLLILCYLSAVTGILPSYGGVGGGSRGDAFKGIWPVTDKTMMRSLNGTWQLKVIKGITDDRTVPACDDTWGSIPVPGCWEAYGFCKPKYDYPDSLTGYYRTEFTVPAEWKGQRIVLRLDGVLRGYDLWINNQLAGTWESGYNTCLFDITPYLSKKGPQQLAMRVYSRFKGYEFDCFDDWATMGIFRNVTLMAVPQTHLSDLTVETIEAEGSKAKVRFNFEVANPKKTTGILLEVNYPFGDLLYDCDFTPKRVGADGRLTIDIDDDMAQLWTAETPNLYKATIMLYEAGHIVQTFEQKFGIRKISIDGNVLKLNGQPVKLRGVNAHSTDPRTVKVISDDLTLKDMRLMKEASVNYMRLSHYPREPRFYELADSLGFYLVNEVPFGYGDKHLSSRSYQDILMTRADATVRRDKNHPSVLVWSVGNENPLPQTCVEVGDYVGRLDPSRPYCFPQVGSYFRRFWEKKQGDRHPFPSAAPVYAPHYPTTGQIGGFYQRLDRPVIFTEYCHTLGISFEDHDRQWEIIEQTPGIAGGSVWEWADQGMPFEMRNETLDLRDGQAYGYQERVYTASPHGDTEGRAGFEMYGNKGTDGLVYADRTPLPNYYELQHNYARAFVSSIDGQRLQIVNRYDFLNLKDNVCFHWALTNDRDTVAWGAFSPDCAPHATTSYELALPPQTGLSLLQFDIADAQGHTFLHQSFVLNKPPQSWTGTGCPMELIQEGPLVRVGRKPTLAERLKVNKQRIERYLQPLDNPYTKADVKVAEADGCVDVNFTLTPDTTHTFYSELGIAFLLHASIDRVQWIGQGPYASYPGRRQANRYGFRAMQQGDLYFEGNRMGVDAALLTDKEGNGLLLTCEQGSVNFEQTDRGIVLTYNAAVSGQGPKFAQTAFGIWGDKVGTVSGQFTLYRIDAATIPQALHRLFSHPGTLPAPRRPYLTQYDTYLMRYQDIRGQ